MSKTLEVKFTPGELVWYSHDGKRFVDCIQMVRVHADKVTYDLVEGRDSTEAAKLEPATNDDLYRDTCVRWHAALNSTNDSHRYRILHRLMALTIQELESGRIQNAQDAQRLAEFLAEPDKYDFARVLGAAA